MTNAFAEARKHQLVRLGDAKPPAPRAAMALAKSQAYQDAADSPAPLRAYAADLANYKAWCERHGFVAMYMRRIAPVRQAAGVHFAKRSRSRQPWVAGAHPSHTTTGAMRGLVPDTVGPLSAQAGIPVDKG